MKQHFFSMFHFEILLSEYFSEQNQEETDRQADWPRKSFLVSVACVLDGMMHGLRDAYLFQPLQNFLSMGSFLGIGNKTRGIFFLEKTSPGGQYDASEVRSLNW